MANPIFDFWTKFFWPKEQVHKHWYSSVDNFQVSTTEFYKMIEAELDARKVPGLRMSRVEFSEGGVLSDKRQYLRLQRERMVFDICAAPFGKSYFFSFRFVELPLGIKPTALIVFLVGLALSFGLLAKLLGTITGFIVLLILLFGAIYVMRNSVALGLTDLDASLLRTPVIGPLYEILLRKETYYREDTRLMYQSIVNGITAMLVDEVTAAKGIKLVKRYERTPRGGEVYRETTNSLGDQSVLASAA